MSPWEDLVMKLRQISDENWMTVLKWIHPIISWLMKCWKTYKKYMKLFRRNPKRANNCETISKEQFYDMPIKVSRNPISFTSCIAMNIFWIGLKDKWIGYKLTKVMVFMYIWTSFEKFWRINGLDINFQGHGVHVHEDLLELVQMLQVYYKSEQMIKKRKSPIKKCIALKKFILTITYFWTKKEQYYRHQPETKKNKI